MGEGSKGIEWTKYNTTDTEVRAKVLPTLIVCRCVRFRVHEHINELIKPDLKLGKARLT